MGLYDSTKRGAKAYVGALGNATKGALGWESAKQGTQLAGDAIKRLKYRSCPRCLETSLVNDGDSWRCLRNDICGFTGNDAAIGQMESERTIDPRVIALAKGYHGDFSKRAQGAVFISRLMWGISFLLASYSLSWVIEGHYGTAAWTMLVLVFCILQSLRYAYMAQRLETPSDRSSKDFLLSPSRWFV